MEIVILRLILFLQCKIIFLKFQYSSNILLNTIKFFNQILAIIIGNKTNFQLVETLMDKIFFTLFKLINKVS